MKEITLTELFTAIVNLTKAIEVNTAAKQDAATAEAVEPKETPATAEAVELKETPATAEDDVEAETDGITLRDVEAALLEVKAEKGAAKAQKLLKDRTGSTSVKKVDPAQYQAILDACEVALSVADDEPEPAQHGDRNKMEELIAELAQSELGEGRPENFETAKRLIKTVGNAAKKADIADENIQPMIDALEKAIADLNGDGDL